MTVEALNHGPAPTSRVALGLGFALLAATAVGAGTFLASLCGYDSASPMPGARASIVGAPVVERTPRTERLAHLRVIAPPADTAPRLHRTRPARPTAAPTRETTVERHPRLFAAPAIADASVFAPATPVRVAGFVPDEAPVDAIAKAAQAPAIVVAETKPADEASGLSVLPKNAEEALEAALVPTPRARPAYRTILSSPPAAAARARPATPLLAYARPDAGMEEDDDALAPARPGLFQTPRAGNGVAIYDIGAATVYMPNGERLEAHSGLGSLRDDARYVHVKMRGPTPPHTYDLRLRESLFHGVAAIRLTPVGGERQIFNRVGLLAHTYMLGKRGDSNGCVSFKDYNRFLAAFRRGEVKRLVVVPHSNPVSRLASLFRAKG